MPVLWAEPLIYLKSLSSDVRPRLPSRMVLPRRVAPKVPRLVHINLLSTLPSTGWLLLRHLTVHITTGGPQWPVTDPRL